MENKNKDWLFLYWDEPMDIKKDKTNNQPKDSTDDLHKDKTTRD